MENYVDIEQLEKIADIANVYSRDELFLISEFKEIFENFSHLYKSQNSVKIADMIDQMNNAISMIAVNSINNITVINKKAEKYTWLKKKIIESEQSATQMIRKTDVNLK